MRIRGQVMGWRQGLPLVALLALAGCLAATPPQVPVSPAPVVAPAPAAAPPVPETPASAAARAHYAKVQRALLAEGLLRRETAPEDAPFSDHNLAENFIRIALYDEYADGVVTARSREAPIPLRRWASPLRVALDFGLAVPAAQADADRAGVRDYLARLSHLTGLSMTLTDVAPNVWIHVATVEERQALAPALRQSLPELTDNQLASITDMAETSYCQVLSSFDPEAALIDRAVVVIPAEEPDLMRLACIHEELAQSLGLPNDSPLARPSIFNDNQEFALLTAQDELMLRMLYDPALRPGMTEREARPIVQGLARRLMDARS